MRRLLLLISIACLIAPSAFAQSSSFPAKDGEKSRYSVQIDFGKAYISGVGIFAYTGNIIAASVFNEFGVSALSFSYNPQKDKVKILSMAGKLNRWYIKYVMKKDLKKVIKTLPYILRVRE